MFLKIQIIYAPVAYQIEHIVFKQMKRKFYRQKDDETEVKGSPGAQYVEHAFVSSPK